MSDPTVGVDFFARLVNVRGGVRVKLQLWDTAGQERFRSITKSYYRNSVGAVLAYDICNMESYKHIPVWLMEAKRHIEPHQATFLMVGCKKDLARTEREVPKETAQVLLHFSNNTEDKENIFAFRPWLIIMESLFLKLPPKLGRTWRKRSP